mgnify:CR=1 FL=1
MEELEHKLKENSEKQGRLIETATAIIDLSGYFKKTIYSFQK